MEKGRRPKLSQRGYRWFDKSTYYCLRCGALVVPAQEDTHTEFHRDLDRRLAMTNVIG